MSHWQKGKVNTVCNMQRMIEAIKAVAPEWADNLVIDPDGGIPIYSYQGNLMEFNTDTGSREGNVQFVENDEGDMVPGELEEIGTFNIMIPGSDNPNHEQAEGVKYNDIGLRMNPDMTWEVQVDNSGLDNITNLEGHISSMAGMQRLKHAADSSGWDSEFRKEGNVTKLTVKPPQIVKQKHSRVR